MRYTGQKRLTVMIGELRRTLPIVEIQPGTWIASDAGLILGDVAFLDKAAELLAEKIRSTRVDAVLTAEAKSISLAYGLSRRLGLERFVVARKSAKSYMGNYASQKVKSITTSQEQELLLTKAEMRWLAGKRVCLLDDVVSTGATLRALQALAKRARAKVACNAAVWKEGPWYKGELVSLGTLPVFTRDGSLV